jgi:ATP phosphoribosyltransferase
MYGGKTQKEKKEDEKMLNIALPKGRLGDDVYKLFDKIGYDCRSIYDDNRKLVFENLNNGVRYFLVKPSDVGNYVERGAADAGVCGTDILLENDYDVYELLDLGLGKCRVAEAAKNDYFEDTDRPLRVASKYVNIAKNYYNSINREIEIIRLNGSIELSPVLGMSDVIVDIVETGATLRENNLKITREIADISARLIVNKSRYKFKNAMILKMLQRLKEATK